MREFLKLDISDVYSHKYTNIKINSDDELINSDDELPLEKKLNMHNVLIHIKSTTVFNKNYNHYYYLVLLKEFSYNYLNK